MPPPSVITTEFERPKLDKNRAVVISKIDDVSIQDWPLKLDACPDSPLYVPGTPLPPGRVLLRVRAGGICGSDVSACRASHALEIGD
jgi:threonine dehydrogenase-like Zn-dependent dehydrogenase